MTSHTHKQFNMEKERKKEFNETQPGQTFIISVYLILFHFVFPEN
jgi:hypothetical protein